MRISSQHLGVIHFIGIGGIGMSGMVEILMSKGYLVRGSDLSVNANVNRLKVLGIPIFKGQKVENIEGASLVVVSSAIAEDNVELEAARSLKIPVMKRAEMLAEIMGKSPCISVAGTHGKTTTTSLGACVLDHGGLDPTVVSGGIINAYGSNARLGAGRWTIVEADESDGTFAKLPATIAIVTNIDPEHIEHYGSFENLKLAFLNYIKKIPFDGLGILCADHTVTYEMACSITDRRLLTYGIENENADIRASQIENKRGGHFFGLTFSDRAQKMLHLQGEDLKKTKGFHLPMAGHHNILNALAVITCALELGIGLNLIKAAIADFMGVERRFTLVGSAQGLLFIDDYAHHPTEIQATLDAAKYVSEEGQKIIAVVQPHRYSRLTDLFSEFTMCFDAADHVVVMPVYAAGEAPSLTVNHKTLARALGIRRANAGKKIVLLESFDDLPGVLEKLGEQGDLCIFMGAGDITTKCRDVFKKMGGTLKVKAMDGEKEKIKAPHWKMTAHNILERTGKIYDT